MIRKLQAGDIEAVLNIWLEASIEAHDFMPADFWKSKLEDMRNIYIPNSETMVMEIDGEVSGFFSLYEDDLAALFVSPEKQGRGLGGQLVAAAKSMRGRLELNVYESNKRAVSFYKKQGFAITGDGQDPHTGHKELRMVWDEESRQSEI